MNESTKDKMEGKKDQAVGQVKETAGQATGNRDLEARGAAQKTSGKIQDKVGDVEKVFEK